MNGLGVALRKLRKQRTLTLREVGKLANVDYAYVQRLEAGIKTKPSVEVIKKLLKTLKPTEREAEIVWWLTRYPDAEFTLDALDDDTMRLKLYTTAAEIIQRQADHAKE